MSSSQPTPQADDDEVFVVRRPQQPASALGATAPAATTSETSTTTVIYALDAVDGRRYIIAVPTASLTKLTVKRLKRAIIKQNAVDHADEDDEEDEAANDEDASGQEGGHHATKKRRVPLLHKRNFTLIHGETRLEDDALTVADLLAMPQPHLEQEKEESGLSPLVLKIRRKMHVNRHRPKGNTEAEGAAPRAITEGPHAAASPSSSSAAATRSRPMKPGQTRQGSLVPVCELSSLTGSGTGLLSPSAPPMHASTRPPSANNSTHSSAVMRNLMASPKQQGAVTAEAAAGGATAESTASQPLEGDLVSVTLKRAGSTAAATPKNASRSAATGRATLVDPNASIKAIEGLEPHRLAAPERPLALEPGSASAAAAAMEEDPRRARTKLLLAKCQRSCEAGEEGGKGHSAPLEIDKDDDEEEGVAHEEGIYSGEEGDGDGMDTGMQGEVMEGDAPANVGAPEANPNDAAATAVSYTDDESLQWEEEEEPTENVPEPVSVHVTMEADAESVELSIEEEPTPRVATPPPPPQTQPTEKTASSPHKSVEEDDDGTPFAEEAVGDPFGSQRILNQYKAFQQMDDILKMGAAFLEKESDDDGDHMDDDDNNDADASQRTRGETLNSPFGEHEGNAHEPFATLTARESKLRQDQLALAERARLQARLKELQDEVESLRAQQAKEASWSESLQQALLTSEGERAGLASSEEHKDEQLRAASLWLGVKAKASNEGGGDAEGSDAPLTPQEARQLLAHVGALHYNRSLRLQLAASRRRCLAEEAARATSLHDWTAQVSPGQSFRVVLRVRPPVVHIALCQLRAAMLKAEAEERHRLKHDLKNKRTSASQEGKKKPGGKDDSAAGKSRGGAAVDPSMLPYLALKDAAVVLRADAVNGARGHVRVAPFAEVVSTTSPTTGVAGYDMNATARSNGGNSSNAGGSPASSFVPPLALGGHVQARGKASFSFYKTYYDRFVVPSAQLLPLPPRSPEVAEGEEGSKEEEEALKNTLLYADGDDPVAEEIRATSETEAALTALLHEIQLEAGPCAATLKRQQAAGLNVTTDSVNTQANLYDREVSPLVLHALAGRGAAVLAYGQSGAGKSFTMFGPSSILTSTAQTTRMVKAKKKLTAKKGEDKSRKSTGVTAKARKANLTLVESLETNGLGTGIAPRVLSQIFDSLTEAALVKEMTLRTLSSPEEQRAAVEALFQLLCRETDADPSLVSAPYFTVKLSLMELHNDKVFDLLAEPVEVPILREFHLGANTNAAAAAATTTSQATLSERKTPPPDPAMIAGHRFESPQCAVRVKADGTADITGLTQYPVYAKDDALFVLAEGLSRRRSNLNSEYAADAADEPKHDSGSPRHSGPSLPSEKGTTNTRDAAAPKVGIVETPDALKPPTLAEAASLSHVSHRSHVILTIHVSQVKVVMGGVSTLRSAKAKKAEAAESGAAASSAKKKSASATGGAVNGNAAKKGKKDNSGSDKDDDDDDDDDDDASNDGVSGMDSLSLRGRRSSHANAAAKPSAAYEKLATLVEKEEEQQRKLAEKNAQLSFQLVRSTLTMVDLAAFSRVGEAGLVGERLREAQGVNKSLSTLGDVMAAIAERQREKARQAGEEKGEGKTGKSKKTSEDDAAAVAADAPPPTGAKTKKAAPTAPSAKGNGGSGSSRGGGGGANTFVPYRTNKLTCILHGILAPPPPAPLVSTTYKANTSKKKSATTAAGTIVKTPIPEAPGPLVLFIACVAPLDGPTCCGSTGTAARMLEEYFTQARKRLQGRQQKLQLAAVAMATKASTLATEPANVNAEEDVVGPNAAVGALGEASVKKRALGATRRAMEQRMAIAALAEAIAAGEDVLTAWKQSAESVAVSAARIHQQLSHDDGDDGRLATARGAGVKQVGGALPAARKKSAALTGGKKGTASGQNMEESGDLTGIFLADKTALSTLQFATRVQL